MKGKMPANTLQAFYRDRETPSHSGDDTVIAT